MTTATTDERKPSVFVSYSRRNEAFISELKISLETYGFEVLFDQEDIASGEPWEPRLRALIKGSESTICVISSAWLESTECTKELGIAMALGRRVIPVIIEPVDNTTIPPELAALNYVFFAGGKATYAQGVADLISALRNDMTWLREQSRILALAEDWADHNRSSAFHLRGEALASAVEWLDQPVPKGAKLIPLVSEFIAGSDDGRLADDRKRQRNRMVIMGLGGLIVTLALGSGLLFFRNMAAQAAIDQQKAEWAARDAEGAAWKIIAEGQSCGAQCSAFKIDQEPAPSEPIREDDIGTIDPGSPAPPPAPGSSGPSPTELAAYESAVLSLNSPDRSTRLAAGQQIATWIRSDAQSELLSRLAQELDPPRLDELSASGRMNVLYMLNIASSLELMGEFGGALSEKLATLETRAASGIAIGTQTRNCMNSLSEKLNGGDGWDNCGYNK